MRRTVVGALIGVGLACGLAAAMVPLRAHLNSATAALVLVIPVVSSVIAGGFAAGAISVAGGFLILDYLLIKPYYTLSVGSGQDLVALAVYAIVMMLVATVVDRLERAQTAARSREASARRLFDLSELLLTDRPATEFAQTIADTVREGFGLSGAALLLSTDGHLQVAAESGDAIGRETLARLGPEAQTPMALSTSGKADAVQTLALATSSRPVGLLALAGVPDAPEVRELLGALGNHLALALERTQLRERAQRAEFLEEIDKLRHALVGAVSHDLRTPLATIKVASSTLLNADTTLKSSEMAELHTLIDIQTDRLTRIVNDVLDMTRIQSGALEPKQQDCSALDLVSEAISMLGPALADRRIEVTVPPTLPLVFVDHLLIEQVISNLLDNADRHAPPGTPVIVGADLFGEDRVALSVSDCGPGVPAAERHAVFDTFVRFDTGGRAGLGLAIAKEFVEAHHETIWVEDSPGGGANFIFTLPLTSGPRTRAES